MVKKQSHPARELFDYIKGDTGERTNRAVEDHLADCSDCSTVADMVRAIKKSQISDIKSQPSEYHPEVSELAEFFYDQLPRGRKSATAAHIALCRSCADQIAEYGRADSAACSGQTNHLVETSIPAAAWKMIHDWEESSFAATRAESAQNDQDMLTRLTRILSLKKDELLNQARSLSVFNEKEDHIPVIIIDQTARFLGVEIFEKSSSSEGESLLKHIEKSERFDNRPFHALLDFGEENVTVVTDTVRLNTVRLQHTTRPDAKLKRVDYFIIESEEKQ